MYNIRIINATDYVCCSVLQCVAVCYSVVQHVAVLGMQCVAVCCSVLQCGAACCSVMYDIRIVYATDDVCCSVLQCVAAVAACCSVMYERCIPYATHDPNGAYISFMHLNKESCHDICHIYIWTKHVYISYIHLNKTSRRIYVRYMSYNLWLIYIWTRTYTGKRVLQQPVVEIKVVQTLLSRREYFVVFVFLLSRREYLNSIYVEMVEIKVVETCVNEFGDLSHSYMFPRLFEAWFHPHDLWMN